MPIRRTDVYDGDTPWFSEGDSSPTHPDRELNSLHAPSPPGQPDFDPDAKRAQIDTGAFATVTGDIQLVHNYREFKALLSDF